MGRVLDRVYLAWDEVKRNNLACLPILGQTRANPACRLARIGAITDYMLLCGLPFDIPTKSRADTVKVNITLSAMQSLAAKVYADAKEAIGRVAHPHRQCLQQIEQSVQSSFHDSRASLIDGLGGVLDAHFAGASTDREGTGRKRGPDDADRHLLAVDGKKIKTNSGSISWGE